MKTNEVSHTPGPWTIRSESQYRPPLVVNSQYYVAECYGPTMDERKANARLIAAAPDLLEALKSIVSSYDSTGCDSCGVVSEGVIESAQSAITRATQPEGK